MKTLVTGASGLLGREVLHSLNQKDEFDAVGVWFKNQIQPGIQVNLMNSEGCESVIREVQPDLILHCAADRDPDSCERNPVEAHKMNLGVLGDLLEKTHRKTKIVFISSDYVFSGDSPPYKEDSQTDPINVYGETKVKGEQMVLQRPDSIVLRVPLLIGAGLSWEQSGFVYKTSKAIESGEEFELDDVGVRFPTWTRDVADFIVWLLLQGENGVFHFRGLRGKTKYGWACELADMMNGSVDSIIPSVDPISYAKRPKDTHLELTRIEALGYSGIHDFREAVADIFLTHNVDW